MKKNPFIPAAIAMALSFLTASAYAATPESLMGEPGSPASVSQTIKITPDTRYVNVQGGKTVQFDVNGQKFIWNFDGTPSLFDLNSVAPPGFLDHTVKAYVSANPLYR